MKQFKKIKESKLISIKKNWHFITIFFFAHKWEKFNSNIGVPSQSRLTKFGLGRVIDNGNTLPG